MYIFIFLCYMYIIQSMLFIENIVTWASSFLHLIFVLFYVLISCVWNFVDDSKHFHSNVDAAVAGMTVFYFQVFHCLKF